MVEVNNRECDFELIGTPKTIGPLALIDLDGTVYRPGLLMAKLLTAQVEDGVLRSEDSKRIKGVKPLMKAIDDYKHGQMGQPANIEKLNKYWIRVCQNVPFSQIEAHARTFVATNKDSFSPFAQPVFNMLNQRGYHIWLLTGEPSFVAAAVHHAFGLTNYAATEWEVDLKNGKLVPDSYKNMMTSKEKKAWTEFLVSPRVDGGEHYLRERSIAIGDSVNDCGMMESVAFSILWFNNQKPEDKLNSKLVEDLSRNNKTCVITSSDETVIRVVDRVTSVVDIETSIRERKPILEADLVYAA